MVLTYEGLEGYFDNAIIIDGGNTNAAKLTDVNIPIIGYAGTNSGENYRYMTGENFKNAGCVENVIEVPSKNHSYMREDAYNIDANNTGISDMLEWAFSSDGESELEQETELMTEE